MLVLWADKRGRWLDCNLTAGLLWPSMQRIVLDEFEVTLHLPDQIAPVGVLHPTKLHLEAKDSSAKLNPDLPSSVVEATDKCGYGGDGHGRWRGSRSDRGLRKCRSPSDAYVPTTRCCRYRLLAATL
jgi:hypothetical protein